MPQFNLDSVLQYEYDLDIKGVGRPYRFGYAFDVDYGMDPGKWTSLEDKNIWNIRFRSDMAYTLNFRFADLKLPYNAELYVYNSNGTVVDGPYTYKNNATEEFRTIGSDLIDGEEVIIQIIEPKEAKQSSSIKIAQVVHGFRDYYSEILSNKDKRGNTFQYNEAVLGCHDNVACYPQFDVASRGIVRLLRGGIAFCSGALTVSMHNGLYDWLIPYPTGNLDDLVCNTSSPCQSIIFENKTLTEDDRIVCKNIILQDVTINSGATLLLQATERITVGSGVVVKTCGTVVVEGLMSINDGYIVENGGSWIIK